MCNLPHWDHRWSKPPPSVSSPWWRVIAAVVLWDKCPFSQLTEPRWRTPNHSVSLWQVTTVGAVTWHNLAVSVCTWLTCAASGTQTSKQASDYVCASGRYLSIVRSGQWHGSENQRQPVCSGQGCWCGYIGLPAFLPPSPEVLQSTTRPKPYRCRRLFKDPPPVFYYKTAVS